MPDRGNLAGHDAAARRRAWLDRRHSQAYELVCLLLRYTPEVDRSRALAQLSTGELRRLAQLLAGTTDLHQVARGILADLGRQLGAEGMTNDS
jgi:hypothetical protein